MNQVSMQKNEWQYAQPISLGFFQENHPLIHSKLGHMTLFEILLAYNESNVWLYTG